MSAKVTMRKNAAGYAAFRKRLASGMRAVVLDAETAAKRETPVRGAYRSFVPGTSPVGGTLRRSVHSVVYLDGGMTFSHVEEGGISSEITPAAGISGFVGTNTGYGAFVELGTRKMTARPFLAPGLDEAVARAGATFTRGMGSG